MYRRSFLQSVAAVVTVISHLDIVKGFTKNMLGR